MGKLITLLTCAVLISATTFLTGCAGTGKTAAYKTLKTISDTVDTAMKTAAEGKVVGAVSDADWEKIRSVHERYRVAFKKAAIAARFDYSTASPEEVASLASELTALIITYIPANP